MLAEFIIAGGLLYISYIISQSNTAMGYIGSFILAIFAGSIIRKALFRGRRKKKHRKRKTRRYHR